MIQVKWQLFEWIIKFFYIECNPLRDDLEVKVSSKGAQN